MSTAAQETFAIVVMVLAMVIVGLFAVAKQRMWEKKALRLQKKLRLPEAVHGEMTPTEALATAVSFVRAACGDPDLLNAKVTIKNGKVTEIEVLK